MEINELFNLKDSADPVQKLTDDQNVFKHLRKRLGIFFILLGVIFIGSAIIDDDYVTLGSLILAAGIALILLLFLLIESFVLFSKEKSILAKTNLIIVGFSVLIIGFFLLAIW